MTTLFFWSGVALWTAIGGFVAWIAATLAMNAVEATVFMWRIIRIAGFKREYSRARKVWAFIKCVLRHTVEPAYEGAEVAGREFVAWPHIWPRRNREATHE